MRKFGWLFVFFAIPALCAFDGEVPGTLKGMLNGVMAGAVAALFGWLKNRDPKGGDMEKFEIKHAVPTILVGAIVGAIAGWKDKDLSTMTAWIQTTPWVITAEIVWKAVFRNSAPVVSSGLKMLMEGTKKDGQGPS